MNLIQHYMTNNDCYKGGRTITVQGLMIHSVGCAQPSAMSFINNWDKPGVQVAVHGLIEPGGDVYQTLPWNRRGWHCASGTKGSGNSTHIGVEMTEPACIKYVGGATWEVKSGHTVSEVETHAKATYKTAVELFAYLCDTYKLNPLADGVIISHSEGYKRGIASNHGDVEHIWNKFGMTMAQFRLDIQAKMTGVTPAPVTPAVPETSTTVYRVQIGAYNVVSNASAMVDKLKKSGFDSFVVTDGGISKVQVGAFTVKSNADSMLSKLKAAGYADAFITETKTEEAKTIKVGGKVKVLKAVDYTGKSFKTYYDQYDVIQVNGDRVVIGIGKTVTAAVKSDNLQAI